MNRAFKWLFWVLVLFVWTNGALAAEPAAKDAKPGSAPAVVSKEAPSIQVPETTFDFGEIMEGSEVQHDFTVKNTGKGTLQIDQVRPG